MTYLPPTKNSPIRKKAAPDTQASDGSDEQASSNALNGNVKKSSAGANSFHLEITIQETQPADRPTDASDRAVHLLTPSRSPSAIPMFAPNEIVGRSTSAPPPHSEVMDGAQWHRSVTPRRSRQEALDLGYSEKSPLARQNNAQYLPGFQRRFFRKQAEDHGYKLATERHNPSDSLTRDEWAAIQKQESELHDKWEQLKKRKISPNEFFKTIAGNTNDQTESEKIALALDLARIISSVHSAPIRLAEDGILDGLTATVSSLKSKRGGLTTTEKAELNNAEMRCAVRQSILASDGIDEGILFLSTFLAPATGANLEADQTNLDGHTNTPPDLCEDPDRLSWTPTKSWAETNHIIQCFQKACQKNNLLAEQQVAAVENQIISLGRSVLPRLAMPVELRDGAKADNLRAQAAKDFVEKEGWDVSPGWHFLRVSAAILGTACGLFFPLLNSRWRDFVLTQFFHSHRMKKVEAYANAEQTRSLKLINKELAKDWVLKQAEDRTESPSDSEDDDRSDDVSQIRDAFGTSPPARTPEESPETTLEETLDGTLDGTREGTIVELSHTASESSQIPSLDVMPKPTPSVVSQPTTALALNRSDDRRFESLVEAIQLELEQAAKGDIFGHNKGMQNESHAAPSTNVLDRDYLLDPIFLRQMAEGIIEGIDEALQEIEKGSTQVPTLDEIVVSGRVAKIRK